MRVVRAVEFDSDDRELVRRAFEGYTHALGDDGHDPPRPRVGLHLNRIVRNAGGARSESAGERYYAADLVDLHEVCDDLCGFLFARADPEWWRKQGAPGDVESLGRQHLLAWERARDLLWAVVKWLDAVGAWDDAAEQPLKDQA